MGAGPARPQLVVACENAGANDAHVRNDLHVLFLDF